MKKCRKCKKEIPENSSYCQWCGAKQTVGQNTKSRGNGTGSVFKRGKTWTAVRVLGYTPDDKGKLHKITRSKGGFKTKKEALEYLPKLNEAKKKALTWGEVYEAWYPTHRASKSTMNCYAAAEKYFLTVKNAQFDQVDIDDLQACMDECEKGKRTKENMKALAGLLYKYAIPRHIATLNLGQYLIVTGDNISAKLALPDDALEKIRHSVGKVEGADYILCQCYLGFRPSELLALDAKDYDRKERAFVGGSKTDAGRDRVVTVSPKIQPIIDRLTKNKIAGPVFCGPDGKAMSIERYRAMFYKALEECGIENPVEGEGDGKRHRYTPHSCRHTFATLMKRVPGADKDKLELIGHTSQEMLRHYQDVSFDDLRRVTDAL
jgi:integrase